MDGVKNPALVSKEAMAENLVTHFSAQEGSSEPPAHAVADAVSLALHEDLSPEGDLSAALVPTNALTDGVIASRSAGVLAGSACATETFAQIDCSVELIWQSQDGDQIYAGDVVATVQGPLASILTAERTALNFLSRLSGVATATAQWVESVAGTGVRIWDTRKTSPGLRVLERAAVRAGGGWNHRDNLSHWVMLKDNHLTGTTIVDAIAASRSMWPGRTVHVECETLEQVLESLEAGADALLLDNMSPESVSLCMIEVRAYLDEHGFRPLVEASGGITLERAVDYALVGVDCISTGMITNGAASLDLGLDLGLDMGVSPRTHGLVEEDL